MTRDTEAYNRWCAKTDGPLLLLAGAFLVVFVTPLYAPDLPKAVKTALLSLNVIIWVAFAADYAMRLRLAPDRSRFVRTHLADLLAIVVPFLRPLRLFRVAGILGTASRRAGQRAQLRTTLYLVAGIAVLLVVSAGLILDAERGSRDANIKTPADALWWASTTVTTVGYGDRYPTTGEGRLVAVLLMLGGIALLGVITASVAAWFVKNFSTIEAEVADDARTTAHALADIADRLDRLEARLEQRR
jgi:voltage-gated potassium channel